jgi:cytochrome P450
MTTPATTPDGYADLRRLVDPAVRSDPYPVLHRLRTASPFVAGPGLVVVGRYADCDRVLRDPTVSSARDGAGAGGRPAGPRTRNFLHLDPPDHTRLRKLVAAGFSPRVVAGLAPRVHGIVAELLAAAAARGDGTLEVVGDLAYPLPVRVICELLGVPYADATATTG